MSHTPQYKEPPPMVVQLNVNQLASIVEATVRSVVTELLTPPEIPQRFAASLVEFGEIVGKSQATIWRWKSQGVFDEAIHQHGHSIMVDIDKAIECIDKHRKTHKKN